MSGYGTQIGIVGLPNAGKSTLFNALVARRLSPTAAHPFTTIKPHEAVVPVPDENLEKLRNILISQYPNIEIVPATITFIDIAGLVKGAHEGAGLGNQFLAKIREVDAIVHVVRVFDDANVAHVHGKIDPKEDIEVVNLELELGGITGKPVIYVYNASETNITQQSANMDDHSIVVCAKLEEELTDLTAEERKQYLHELDIEESGLEQLIKKAYKILGLVTFYTIKGGKEIHAWSLKSGETTLKAAEKVHTDFAINFIRAQVIEYDKLIEAGSYGEAKKRGLIRTEGKDYLVQDGDVIEFLIGS